MSNLRDQLLRAGLVDKKQKQQADAASRKKRKRKRRKADRGAEERERAAKYAEKVAREAEEHRVQALQARQERQANEEANRVGDLVGAHALREARPGRRRWYFADRAGRIRWFDLSAATAWQLGSGALAIAERPGDEDEPFAIIPRRIAERVAAVDTDYIRFWNREPGNEG